MREQRYTDTRIISEEKETGRLRLLCIVVKKDLIEHYLGLADRLDARISGIEISSTAIANYVSSQEGRDAKNRCAFIYLSEDHLEINFLAERLLTYSRTVKRREWGDNLPERLFQELQKLREGLGEDHGWLETVFCGSKADLEMPDHFKNEEDLDLHPMDLSKAGIPSFALIPAYGLALKGIRKAPMEINLLPPGLRRKPGKIAYYTMVVLAGLLLLAAFSWGGGNILRHKLRLDYLGTEIKRLSSEIKRVDQLRTEGKKIEDRIDYLNTLAQGGVPVLEILKDLSERIPENAWVHHFSFSEKGIQIEGQAGAASELIPLLEASPLFRDVKFLSAITKKGGKERFKIGLNKKLLK
jgi:general secretion pathway protein L